MEHRAAPYTAREIVDKLEALGGSPGAIAAKLVELGIKGHARDGSSCPLSRYLEREGVRRPIVWESSLITRDTGLVSIPLPPVCRGFIDAFDKHAWPELLLAPDSTPEEAELRERFSGDEDPR